MVFQLQPAPATRSFTKNRVSPPRTPRSHSPTSSLSNSEGSSGSQDEGFDSDKSQFQSSSRFQEHFSWGTLPGTASLDKPGVPAFAPLDQMPNRRNTRSSHRGGTSELPSLVRDGTSGSETEVDSEVEPLFNIGKDRNLLSLPSNKPHQTVGSVELQYEDDDEDTPGSTPVPLLISPRSPQNGSRIPTSVRYSNRSYSSNHGDRGSLRSLEEGFDFLSKEEAEKVLLNARLSASAGSAASSRTGGETRSWNRESFTSATRTPTQSRLSSMRRRSSVKSPTNAEIQVLSFGDQQEEQGQELIFTTPRYDRPSSNFLALPSPSSSGSRRHTSLLLPPFSPISPRSAAAQHSPSTQDRNHLSIGTAPLSATLLALGVNREAHHYVRGNDSSPSDDDEDGDERNPRWSMPFWARRSEVLDQQAAVEKNKKAIRDGKGLPRTTQPGQEPTSPNGGVLEMSNMSGQFQEPTSTPEFLESPAPIKQRGAIESTVRAGRLAASRFSTSLASFISGNGSTTGSQRGAAGQGWRGALPYTKRASSPPPLPLQAQNGFLKGKSDGWGGSRASWFPSSLLGPLVSPNSLNVKSSPRLKSLHLSPSLASRTVRSPNVPRTRPGLRVHFAPVEKFEEGGNDTDWIDEDEAQELLESPRQGSSRYSNSNGSPISYSSKFKRPFTVSNPFKRRSSATFLRSPTSPINFIPPPPTTFNNGFPIGFRGSYNSNNKSNSKSRGNSMLEENMNDGVAVTYRDGSAEGKPFNNLQQIRSQRKKTAIRRMGLVLAIFAFLAIMINVLVLDFKLLPVKDSKSNENQASQPAPEIQASLIPSVAAVSSTSSSSTLPSSSTSTTMSSNSMNQATSSSTSLSPTPTPISTSVSDFLNIKASAPVSAAVRMSGRDDQKIGKGKESDRNAYRFFGVKVE